MQAIAALGPESAAEPLSPLLTDQGAPIGLREATATALSKTNQENARIKLVEALAVTGDRLQTTIAAALASNKQGAELSERC